MVLVSDLLVLLQEIQLPASQLVVFKGFYVSPDRKINSANGDLTAFLDCVFHGSIRFVDKVDFADFCIGPFDVVVIRTFNSVLVEVV